MGAPYYPVILSGLTVSNSWCVSSLAAHTIFSFPSHSLHSHFSHCILIEGKWEKEGQLVAVGATVSYIKCSSSSPVESLISSSHVLPWLILRYLIAVLVPWDMEKYDSMHSSCLPFSSSELNCIAFQLLLLPEWADKASFNRSSSLHNSSSGKIFQHKVSAFTLVSSGRWLVFFLAIFE